MSNARKILIIDDDDELRESLSEQLTLHEEFDTMLAATASDGLKQARSGHVDLVLQDVGGWWVDDIAIANSPLLGGVVARAITPEAVAEPGGTAVFRIKVANVGDFEDDVGFALQPPPGWAAGIGANLSTLQDYQDKVVRLGPDAEANLLLVFAVSVNETRGSRHPVAVTAVSRTNASLASTFNTVTIINDPLGLSGLMRYLFLFIIVFAVIVVIAVVIDAVKKQKGVYRRW